jgi:hypothetical protein
LYKVIIISIVVLVISNGCAVSKSTEMEISSLSQINTQKTIQLTEKQNITNSSFFIERGRISTSGDGGRINLLFTMKYSLSGNYLISLKSTTGIEAFRVYLTEDTVLINDRMNQVTLYGNPFEFEKISGLPSALFKLIIGDFFISGENKEIPPDCLDNSMAINDYYKGLIVKSIIDCKLGKTKMVTLTSGTPNELINIFYSKYKPDRYKIPGKIEVNDFRRKVKIVIKIEKYSVPWSDEMKFIPGNGYKLKRLL